MKVFVLADPNAGHDGAGAVLGVYDSEQKLLTDYPDAVEYGSSAHDADEELMTYAEFEVDGGPRPVTIRADGDRDPDRDVPSLGEVFRGKKEET